MLVVLGCFMHWRTMPEPYLPLWASSNSQLKRICRSPLQVFFKIERYITAFEETAVGNGRIDFFVGLHQVHKYSAVDVCAIELIGVNDAGSGTQLNKTFYRVLMKVGHALLLVGDDQSPGQVGILRSDAGGAVVGVAFQGLNTSYGHHHGAGAVGGVGPQGHGPHNVEAGQYFSRGNQPKLVADTKSTQCIIDKRQCIEQRHPDEIGKLGRGSASASFATVDGNEIGVAVELNHRFAEREKFSHPAHTQFEAYGLSAREFAQFLHKSDQFNWRTEGAVKG